MSIKTAIQDFDFESYIDKKFDKLYPTGKPYRVRTHCPFCDDEKTGHFYIHIPRRVVFCQKCKYDPKWLPKFLADMEGLTSQEAINLITDSTFNFVEKRKVDEIVEDLYPEEGDYLDEFSYEKLEFDSTFVNILTSTDIPSLDRCVLQAKSYLNGRGVSDFQIQKYDIRYCYDGRFGGRIIVPCYYQGDLVTFVGRDIMGDSFRKYLNPTANKQGDFLFNYDRVKGDRIVVAEGVFDAIAIGENAVASFGKSLSQRQISLLNKFKEVIFYWDDDAYEQVERYAGRINGSVRTILHPDALDAGSRSYEENQRIIEEAVFVNSVASSIFSICR